MIILYFSSNDFNRSWSRSPGLVDDDGSLQHLILGRMGDVAARGVGERLARGLRRFAHDVGLHAPRRVLQLVHTLVGGAEEVVAPHRGDAETGHDDGDLDQQLQPCRTARLRGGVDAFG
jgi:hypothetical protein